MAKIKRPSVAVVNRVCTPEDLERLTILKARGRTWNEIAVALNARVSQVIEWYRARVEPVWKALGGRHVHEELARLNEIERECWRRYEDSVEGSAVDPVTALKGLKLSKPQKAKITEVVKALKPNGAKMAWLVTIMAVIDLRARLRGDFAPSKSSLSIDASVRVAGSTPAAVNQEMLGRLLAKVEERRNYEAALKQGSNN